MKNYTLIYMHGMGGGGDSRIPTFLREHLNDFTDKAEDAHIDVVVRTYDIDPEIADGQISSWMKELRPQLVLGESLGSLHAIRQKGLPHILVSPAIGAARWMSAVSLIPGVPALMRRLFVPYSDERQSLDFTHKILRHYRGLRRKVLDCSPARGGKDYFYAFFGDYDTYRRSGVVSVRSWKRHFGPDSCKTYKGTHYMEEEYLCSMLIPKILEVLGLKAGPTCPSFLDIRQGRTPAHPAPSQAPELPVHKPL